MKRLTAASAQETLQRLVGASVSGTVQRSGDTFALIRSFQAHFNKLNRTPEMIRVMLQAEFGFTGVVDASAANTEEKRHMLEADWFDSSFVVVNYSDVETWMTKVLREVEQGRVVVALVPARTNTQWFHESVLERADEVRFVKGRVTFPGRTAPSAYPDALAIFRATGPGRERGRSGSVAILRCSDASADAN